MTIIVRLISPFTTADVDPAAAAGVVRRFVALCVVVVVVVMVYVLRYAFSAWTMLDFCRRRRRCDSYKVKHFYMERGAARQCCTPRRRCWRM